MIKTLHVLRSWTALILMHQEVIKTINYWFKKAKKCIIRLTI